MATTGPKNCTGKYVLQINKTIIKQKIKYILVLIYKYKFKINTYGISFNNTASFPLTINKGKRIENTQPLKKKK